jgi:hypothetical protein
MKAPAYFTSFLAAMSAGVLAQAPGVPIVRDDGRAPAQFVAAAKKLQEAGKLLPMEAAKEQLKRGSCELKLPAVESRVLSGGDLWERARAAHVRIGYLYLCTKCTNLHLNLAGGYAISEDGAVATCFHVIEPKDMKQGHLVAATEGGGVIPVIEVLAANRANDVAIVRVQSDKPLKPLPLNVNVRPGDEASCYSDPFGRSSYFSKGIVNRFFQRRSPNAGSAFSTRVNVSTDWAPGSSGSAVLDSFGNAIGHVSEISAHGGPAPKNPSGTGAPKDGQTFIVFHDAARAADVLALVKPKQ